MKLLTLLIGIISPLLFAASPKPVWKTGVLVEAAEQREVAGATGAVRGVTVGPPPGCTYCPARNTAAAGSAVVYATLQGYVIRGDDMVYMVQMRLKTTGLVRRTEVRPNVTVKGPIKYAAEKGKFYILDEDGKEFEMAVMQKRLLTDDEKKQLSAPAKPQ